MTMKCFYAITKGDSEAAKALTNRYSEALTRLSDDVITMGENLRAFAEMHGVAVLKLEDDDWLSAAEGLSQPSDRELAGELFWSPSDAQRVRRMLDEGIAPAASQAVSAWLGIQADRERAILLLAE